MFANGRRGDDRMDEEDGTFCADKDVALEDGREIDVAAAEVQQPGDLIQRRHNNRIDAQRIQFGTHCRHFVLPRLTCDTRQK